MLTHNLHGPDDEFEVQVERLTESLCEGNGMSVPRNVVEQAVRECLGEWRDVPVKDYVDILVERSVRARLRGNARPVATPATAPA